jgi:hypothetical protein
MSKATVTALESMMNGRCHWYFAPGLMRGQRVRPQLGPDLTLDRVGPQRSVLGHRFVDVAVAVEVAGSYQYGATRLGRADERRTDRRPGPAQQYNATAPSAYRDSATPSLASAATHSIPSSPRVAGPSTRRWGPLPPGVIRRTCSPLAASNRAVADPTGPAPTTTRRDMAGEPTSLGVERMDSLYVDTESTRWATDFGLS